MFIYSINNKSIFSRPNMLRHWLFRCSRGRWYHVCGILFLRAHRSIDRGRQVAESSFCCISKYYTRKQTRLPAGRSAARWLRKLPTLGWMRGLRGERVKFARSFPASRCIPPHLPFRSPPINAVHYRAKRHRARGRPILVNATTRCNFLSRECTREGARTGLLI